MTNVLSLVNAKSWSWGLNIRQLTDRMTKYRFVNVLRIPPMKCQCGAKFAGVSIDDSLIEFFDLTLLQNADSIQLIKSKQTKAVVRMGGMLVDEQYLGSRYDEQLAMCGAVISTNNLLHDIASNVNPNSFMIPNGVDLDLFKPAEKKANRKFTAGFAGNIWGPGAIYKGYNVYVQALVRIAPEIKMKNLLHAHSQIPHADMPEKFYHKIDCLVLPSIGEGCSNVTTEALACGVPVIITKVGYHGEMLTDGKDCLFCEREIDSIADCVKRLAEDEELRNSLSVNGRMFAEKHHDINVIAKQYDQVFQLVINRNKELV